MSPAAPEKETALYLLVGKEDFLKKEFVRELRESLFPKGAGADFNSAEFHAGESSVAGLVEFLQTAPFLAEKRLAVLYGADDLEEDERDSVALVASRLPSTAVLVLVAGEGARKNAFILKISETAKVVPCHTPYDRDLPGWIEARARRAGVTVDRDAVPVLVERAGRDTAALASSVESLALYVSPAKRVSRADVEKLLGKSVQADVFELVDRVLESDAASAARILSQLFDEGTKGFEVMPVLASQFERLRRARRLLDRGASPRDVCAELKVPPFFSDKFMRQAGKMTSARIVRATEKLLACDEGIKTGKAGDRIAVERLVLELCL